MAQKEKGNTEKKFVSVIEKEEKRESGEVILLLNLQEKKELTQMEKNALALAIRVLRFVDSNDISEILGVQA